MMAIKERINCNRPRHFEGPPGTGKSHTADEMILTLIREGKKVGITAFSHKVILGLIEKVIQASKKAGISIHCLRKVY